MSKPFELVEGRFPITEDLAVTGTLMESKTSTSVTESKTELPKKLIVDVEAIHAGMTKNFNFYSAPALQEATPSWTDVYNKPVLKNHDSRTEPLGRVQTSEFRDSQLSGGKKCVALSLELTDQDAIAKVLDGRYKTLSIGGSAEKAMCSICGKDVTQEWCGHWKGDVYDGQQCHYSYFGLGFDEISFVNMPADVYSQVTGAKPQESVSNTGENAGMTEGRVMLVTTSTENQESVLETVDQLLGNDPGTEPEPKPEEGNDNPPAPEGSADPKPAEEPVTVESLQAVITSLEEKVTTLEGELQTAKDQIETVVTEKATADADVVRLTSEVATANQESQSMLRKNVDLAKALHRQMAERVIDWQIHLGQQPAEKREELLSEAVKETASSLNSQITVLMAEKPEPRVPGKVTVKDIPTAESQEPETTTEGTTGGEKTYTLDELVESAVRVLTGKRERK